MYTILKKDTSAFIMLLFFTFNFLIGQRNYDLDMDTSSLVITGTSTLHDWKVTSKKFYGSLNSDSKQSINGRGGKGQITNGKFIVEAEKIISERGKTMDNKMYKALKSDIYPKIIFLFESTYNAGATEENMVKGLLEIAGKENKVELQAMVSKLENTITIKGFKELKLTDYGINPPSAMFGQIETGNEIIVYFDLKFIKS